jgi:tetratricopeptide (TPR) repeat protein
MTLAEHMLLAMRMSRLAGLVVEWHYKDADLRPGAKERSLARISERTGNAKEAEEYYRRAIQYGEVDGYLFLGQFYERRQRTDSAIRTYERAVAPASDEPQLLHALKERLEELHGADGR